MRTPRKIAAGVLAGAIVAIVAGAGTAAGSDSRQFTPPVYEEPAIEVSKQIRDRVFAESHARAASSSRLVRNPRRYSDADGHQVNVEVSDAYPVNLAGEQALVDFLGSLTHGAEMSKLNVYVATPLEIPSICGGLAAACYFPGDDTMVIVGQGIFGGLPTNFVAAHEYGHHIQNHRSNSPWPALAWGTKRWATGQRVCPRYLAGKLFPGDRANEFPGSSEDFYWQNPGEAFAEAYARSHSIFASQPWDWIRSLLPSAGDYSRIRTDVTDPWSGNTTKRFSKRLGNRDRARGTFTTPLDGKVIVKLRAARGTDFDLGLRDQRGRLIGLSKKRGSREKVRSFSCGDDRLTYEVRSIQGKGKAKVSVSRP